MSIERVQIWRSKLPLNEPYSLALGVLNVFDAFIVKVESSTGVAWGEVSALPGYHKDTAGDIWEFLKINAQRIIGKAEADAESLILNLREDGCFKSAPLEMAIEKLLFQQTNDTQIAAAIPLIGVLKKDRDPEAQCLKLKDAGCRVVKVKIGSEVDEEIAWLKRLKNVSVINHFKIRFDANQSLDFDTAMRFCKVIQELPFVFLEQPFDIDKWELTRKLIEQQPVPVMLDEAIFDEEDIQQSEKIGVKWIKFKLAKQGTERNMFKLVRLVESLGMGVIIGNGVATEISCQSEGAVWARAGCKEPGEMNGFCKLKAPLLKNPFKVKNFIWDYSSTNSLSVNEAMLSQYAEKYHETINVKITSHS